jgi:2-amino-4-hydroxy-6-hydroxymethyldihydropteridine diphosphokinase
MDGGARAWVGLGSNVGDRAAALERALAALAARGDVRVVRRSPLYETDPVGGPPGQGRFLNGAAELETAAGLGAEELGERLLEAERAAGRKRGGGGDVRWGPREADLDLLLWGARGEGVLRTERWTVPHPMLHMRAFVLRPLCDLAPDLVHPLLRRSVAELLAEVTRW